MQGPKTADTLKAIDWIDQQIILRRAPLLVVTLLYLIVWHATALGFTSWDGFVHRVPPIVELLQHGSIDAAKLDNPYVEQLYFLELVHLPFLALGGLAGLLFSFPSTLLPLAACSVCLLGERITGDVRAGTYAGVAYLGIPFVNEQPFGAYIDFAVVGLLAFFLYRSLVFLDEPETTWRGGMVLAGSALACALSKQFAPYLLLGLTCVLILQHGFFGPSTKRRVRSFSAWALVGIGPALAYHALLWIAHGSPIFPYQLEVLGYRSQAGIPFYEVAYGAGLTEYETGAKWSQFLRAWFWPDSLPHSFYHSIYLGAGVSLPLAVLALPLASPLLRGRGFLLVAALASSSFLAGVFWLPRYSAGLVLAVTLVLGCALARAVHARRYLAYTLLLVPCLIQLYARPIYAAWGIATDRIYYARMNVMRSPLFVEGYFGTVLTPYPDWSADLFVVHPLDEFFLLPLYGQRLTNSIAETVSSHADMPIEEICGEIRRVRDRAVRRVVLVEHQRGVGKECGYSCIHRSGERCLAYAVD